MHHEVIQIRRDICGDCKEDCAVRASIKHSDPCAECPLRKWHYHGDCSQEEPERPGLGDIVEKFVKPIAKALKLPCLKQDGSLKPESPCAKRRDWLNKL